MASNIISLIRKDFYALLSEKTMGSIFIISLLIFGPVGVSIQGVLGLFFAFIIVSNYIQNVSNLDEKYGTEKFFVSLASHRREIVFARYGGVMTIMGILIVMAYLANGVIMFLVNPKLHPIPIGYFASLILIVSLITSVTFPLYFKYGFAKAKNVLMFFTFVLATPLILYNFRGSHSYIETILAALKSPFPSSMVIILLLIGISIISLGVSISLSVAVYSKKDL